MITGFNIIKDQETKTFDVYSRGSGPLAGIWVGNHPSMEDARTSVKELNEALKKADVSAISKWHRGETDDA